MIKYEVVEKQTGKILKTDYCSFTFIKYIDAVIYFNRYNINSDNYTIVKKWYKGSNYINGTINRNDYNINDIEYLKYICSQLNSYFFSESAMKFFKSKIYDIIYENKYFITSEKNGSKDRMFTIRSFEIYNSNSINIETIGDFQRFKTKKQAISFLNKFLNNKKDN